MRTPAHTSFLAVPQMPVTLFALTAVEMHGSKYGASRLKWTNHSTNQVMGVMILPHFKAHKSGALSAPCHPIKLLLFYLHIHRNIIWGGGPSGTQ
jgi:hypothetical protein